MLIYDEYPDLLDEHFLSDYDLVSCFTRTNDEKVISELDVAVALIREEGNLAGTARTLGRSRNQIGNFIARNDKLSELYEEIEAAFLDDVEAHQKTVALSGDPQAQRFFLTTKGKGRGYTTKQELDHESPEGTMTPPAVIELIPKLKDECSEDNSEA